MISLRARVGRPRRRLVEFSEILEFGLTEKRRSVNGARTPEFSAVHAVDAAKKNACVIGTCGETDPRGFSFRARDPERNVSPSVREYLEGNFCYQCNIPQREAPETAHWLSPRRSLLHPARCLLVYNITWYTRKWNKRLYVTCTASEFRPSEEAPNR